MTMKRTELDKRMGLQIANAQRRAGNRYDTSAVAADRREQRERDRAAGLVPFAVKLHGDLVRQLQDMAGQRKLGLGELVEELLRTAMNKGNSR